MLDPHRWPASSGPELAPIPRKVILRGAIWIVAGVAVLAFVHTRLCYRPVLIADIPAGGRIHFGYAVHPPDYLGLHGCYYYVTWYGSGRPKRYFVYNGGEPPYQTGYEVRLSDDGARVWMTDMFGSVTWSLDMATGEFRCTNGLAMPPGSPLSERESGARGGDQYFPPWANAHSGTVLPDRATFWNGF